MKESILYICILFVSSTFCFGQTSQISFVESFPGQVTADTTLDANGNPEVFVTVEKWMNCELTDTIQINNIRIQLGSEQGQSDLLNQSFALGGEVISQTLYMQRMGLGCRFRLGSFTNRDLAYMRIETRNASGAVLGYWEGILN